MEDQPLYKAGRRAGRELEWIVLAKGFGEDEATRILGFGPPDYGIEDDA